MIFNEIIKVFYVCLILISCSLKDFKNPAETEFIMPGDSSETHFKDVFQRAFIFKCDEELRIWIGSLQSLESNQKKEKYVFGQCISGKDAGFDVIWAMNEPYEQRTENENNLESKFETNYNNNVIVEGFNTFLFKLFLQKVKDPLLDDPYNFPVTVSVFRNSGDSFIRKGDFVVNTWEEYVQLQYKFIFSQ